MWYITLFEQLGRELLPEQQMEAAFLIKTFFKSLTKELYLGRELGPQLIFGMLVDTYIYCRKNKDQKIPLERFARQLLGTAILHVKSSNDKETWCSEFIPMMMVPEMYALLGIHKQFMERCQQYCSGKLPHPKINFSGSQMSGKEYALNREQIKIIVLTDIAKQLERETFFMFDYVVKADFDEFITVFNRLINKVDNSFAVLRSLYLFLLPYRHKDPQWDGLLLAVYQALGSFKHFGRELNLLSAAKVKIDGLDLGWILEFCHKNDELYYNASAPKMGARLMPVPLLRLDLLPQCAQNIKDIVKQLSPYASPAISYTLFADKKPSYVPEISDLLMDIRKGIIDNEYAILERLENADKTKWPKELRSIVSQLLLNNRGYVMIDYDEMPPPSASSCIII